MQQVASRTVANRKTIFGIQYLINLQCVGAGCGRYNFANLAKFAGVVANFARNDTKPPQNPKANVGISPTCESEIELEKRVLNF